MKTRSILLSLAAAALAAAPALSATKDTGRPYLKRPALTAPEMAAQVTGDPQLLARYAKHFHTAPASVSAAMRAAKPLTLPAGEYTVWLTGPNGLRYPTVQERATETRAFAVALKPGADPAWLEAGTGNPMALFRPVEQVVVVEAPAPEPARAEEVETPREILVAAGR